MPVGPDKEEVAGANDDYDYTSDREEATIKLSFPDRKSTKKISDKELLVIISEGTAIACLSSCGTTSCNCLDILLDVNVQECVAYPWWIDGLYTTPPSIFMVPVVGGITHGPVNTRP